MFVGISFEVLCSLFHGLVEAGVVHGGLKVQACSVCTVEWVQKLISMARVRCRIWIWILDLDLGSRKSSRVGYDATAELSVGNSLACGFLAGAGKMCETHQQFLASPQNGMRQTSLAVQDLATTNQSYTPSPRQRSFLSSKDRPQAR